MKFINFLQSPLRNVWVCEPHMRIYMRKAVHLIGTEMIPCLDVASVEVDGLWRGKGIFSTFLTEVEIHASTLKRVVFVESIMEPRLLKFLQNRGYSLVPGCGDIAPCVYKKV